jgi:site-specific recombinase XerD
VLEFLDIRFRFWCRSAHRNAQGQSPIILRVHYGGQRRDLFTGLYCLQDDWDPTGCCVIRKVKTSPTINRNLQAIAYAAQSAFDALKYKAAGFTIDDLVAKFKGKEAKPVLLIDFLQDSLIRFKKRVGVEITRTTFLKYRRSLQHLQEFLETEFNLRNYPLARMDGKFIERYFLYLRKVRSNSHNSAIKSMQLLKAALDPAIKSGLVHPNPFDGFKMKPKKLFREFLTVEEVNRLWTVDLKSSELSRIRDIFLFACYTGLAYSDIKQLSGRHFLADMNQRYCIRKARQKTGEESIIPLLPPAVRILQKYSLTGDVKDFRWSVSSNQKMNFRLKAIASKAGIEKNLHMHLARHTFATTITLSNGVPIETVSSMLGHASIKQTQHYARIVAEKIKQDMLKLATVCP